MARLRIPYRWPWPVPEVSSPGDEYPLGVDLATALRWVWRVRHWNFALSASLSQAATWTWNDPHLTPTSGTGAASFHAELTGRIVTRPDPLADPYRTDETVLLAGADYGSGLIASGGDAGGHLDGLAGTYSTPFISPPRPVAARFDFQVSFMDPYWPYNDPTFYAPPLVYDPATDLYYPRLLVYAAAAAGVPGGPIADPTTQPTVPTTPFAVGASVAMATLSRASALALPSADNWPLGTAYLAPGATPPVHRIVVDGRTLDATLLATRTVAMAPDGFQSGGGTAAPFTHHAVAQAPALGIEVGITPLDYWEYRDRLAVPLYRAEDGQVALTDRDTGESVDPVRAPYP